MMRFAVESWAPDYGVSGEADRETEVPTDTDVEVSGPWTGIAPEARPAAEVCFVDGVRRVDANVWIEQPDDVPAYGVCATYAAGAVRCAAAAEVVVAMVERSLFTAAVGATDIETIHGRYTAHPAVGNSPEELWLRIQERMGALEGTVSAEVSGSELVVVDGPLSHHAHVPSAVGYIKTHHVHYLPIERRPILMTLEPGRRSPLFLIGGGSTRYSWYLRLAPGAGSTGGLVRCEITANRSVEEARSVADVVTATLPRFASAPHKDPRAPQNLYPIAGLERDLRRRLGDQFVMERALRRVAG
jgi:hypothetical protein